MGAISSFAAAKSFFDAAIAAVPILPSMAAG
jgi:hypothetical protein